MATQSLKTIESQIRKLQARAEALREKDRKPVIAAIVKQMKAHDISLAEIGEALGKRRAPRAASKAASGRGTKTVRKPVPPKYRDPETGATWSGRGRTPRWIVDAEQSGKDRSSFAI
ncbi:MAG: H-NS histone family protein [Limnobacter sp.]|nr:H-NS histone family protein [Limnobacter sp.]